MLNWLWRKLHQPLLLQLQQLEQSLLEQTTLNSSLRQQNDVLQRRAVEAESRRDSEGNGYRSRIDDMKKEMDWMARMLGKGPIFDRQVELERVEEAEAKSVPETMDEIIGDDPMMQEMWLDFQSKGQEFMSKLGGVNDAE